MDGMVIIGHRSSKSTFGANKLAGKTHKLRKIEWHKRVKYVNPDFEEKAKKLIF